MHFKMWSLLALSVLLILVTAADDPITARYSDLGHRLICMCDGRPASEMGRRGCQQVLLECGHADCDMSPRMRHELKAALQTDIKDDAVLQWFVQKYGTTVLLQPTANGINRFGWIALSTLLAATLMLAAFIRKRSSHPPTVSMPNPELQSIDMDALRRRVREDTEENV
jgi:cytochrome c-type biogenesis protein CcmH/NrfF